MATPRQFTFIDEEDPSRKLSRKFRDDPFMTVGLGGLVVALGIAAYKFKHRGQMSTSVFLMQTRVAAQGTVVGVLSIGLAYSMFKKHVLHQEDND